MGMSGASPSAGARPTEAISGAMARQAIFAGGLGAVAKVLRMMLQSAVLAVGRLSRHPPGSLSRHHHRGFNPQCAGAGAGRSRHCALERSVAGARAVIASTRCSARCRRRYADVAAEVPSKRLSVEGVSIVAPGEQRVIVQEVTFAVEAGSASASLGRAAQASRRWCAGWSVSARAVRRKVRLEARRSTSGRPT